MALARRSTRMAPANVQEKLFLALSSCRTQAEIVRTLSITAEANTLGEVFAKVCRVCRAILL